MDACRNEKITALKEHKYCNFTSVDNCRSFYSLEFVQNFTQNITACKPKA